jgi:hypothetical protein
MNPGDRSIAHRTAEQGRSPEPRRVGPQEPLGPEPRESVRRWCAARARPRLAPLRGPAGAKERDVVRDLGAPRRAWDGRRHHAGTAEHLNYASRSHRPRARAQAARHRGDVRNFGGARGQRARRRAPGVRAGSTSPRGETPGPGREKSVAVEEKTEFRQGEPTLKSRRREHFAQRGGQPREERSSRAVRAGVKA